MISCGNCSCWDPRVNEIWRGQHDREHDWTMAGREQHRHDPLPTLRFVGDRHSKLSIDHFKILANSATAKSAIANSAVVKAGHHSESPAVSRITTTLKRRQETEITGQSIPVGGLV